MEPIWIQFVIKATYDQLPTKINLMILGKTEIEKSLCSLEHILSSCNSAKVYIYVQTQ